MIEAHSNEGFGMEFIKRFFRGRRDSTVLNRDDLLKDLNQAGLIRPGDWRPVDYGTLSDKPKAARVAAGRNH